VLSVAFETVSTVRGHHQARSSTPASEQSNNGFAGLVDNNLAAADQFTATPAKPATNNAAPASQQPVASAIKNDDANDRQTAPAIDVSDRNKTRAEDPVVASTFQAVASAVSTAPAVVPDSADATDDTPKSADADSSAAGNTPAMPAVGIAPPQPPVATAIANPAAPLPSLAVADVVVRQ